MLGNYPKERELDGVYNRVEREGKRYSLCFTDLTVEEQQVFLNRLDFEGLHRMCLILAGSLRALGDRLDIVCDEE